MAEDKVKKSEQEEIVINLDSFGVPIAIVVAGILIAVGIFFTNKNKDTNVDAGDEPTVAGEENNTETNGDNPYAKYMTEGKSVNIDDDPYIGDKESAKFAIVEFSDYQCGFCGRHTTETLPTIIEEYVDTGEIIYVFRDYQMYGEVSETTAMIGECIADDSMDTFLKYHEEGYSVSSVNDAYNFAKDLGLNVDDLKSCVDSYDKSELTKDMEDGQGVGITGTPAFVVGVLSEDGNVEGTLISGALPFDAFELVVNGLKD